MAQKIEKIHLPQILKDLRSAIAKLPKTIKSDRTRHYARHHLHMRSNGFKRVSEWFKNPNSITVEETTKLSQVLYGAVVEPQMPAPGATGRRVVRHMVSVLSSLKSLAGDIAASDVTDEDRLYAQNAMEVVSARFGIIATFKDPADKKSRPATRQDFVEAGLKPKR